MDIVYSTVLYVLCLLSVSGHLPGEPVSMDDGSCCTFSHHTSHIIHHITHPQPTTSIPSRMSHMAHLSSVHRLATHPNPNCIVKTRSRSAASIGHTTHNAQSTERTKRVTKTILPKNDWTLSIFPLIVHRLHLYIFNTYYH